MPGRWRPTSDCFEDDFSTGKQQQDKSVKTHHLKSNFDFKSTTGSESELQKDQIAGVPKCEQFRLNERPIPELPISCS